MGKWILAGLLTIATSEVLGVVNNFAEAQVVVVPSYGPIYNQAYYGYPY